MDVDEQKDEEDNGLSVNKQGDEPKVCSTVVSLSLAIQQ